MKALLSGTSANVAERRCRPFAYTRCQERFLIAEALTEEKVRGLFMLGENPQRTPKRFSQASAETPPFGSSRRNRLIPHVSDSCPAPIDGLAG